MIDKDCKMRNILFLLDKIAIKWIEYRSNFTRNEIIALYNLAEKRKYRRVMYCYPNESLWKCVDECIFCNSQKSIFEHKDHIFVQNFFDNNPIVNTSLIDQKGLWR